MAGIKITGVDVNINTGEIKSRILGKLDSAKLKMNKQVLEDSNKFVRMQTGKLKDSGYYDEDGVGYSTAYAEYAYADGTKVSTDVNPEASSRWVDVAKEKYINDWVKILKEGLD